MVQGEMPAFQGLLQEHSNEATNLFTDNICGLQVWGTVCDVGWGLPINISLTTAAWMWGLEGQPHTHCPQPGLYCCASAQHLTHRGTE